MQLKNIGATACRCWARAETFNGLQKVLQTLYFSGPPTLWTFLVSDQEILMKELEKKQIFFEKNEKIYF